MAIPQNGHLPPALQHGGGAHIGRIFGALGPVARDEIARISTLRTITAGETVIADGEECQYLGFILDGIFCMKKRLQDGRAHIIGLLTPFDMFGRIFVGRSDYSVEALTDAQVFCLQRSSFERILRQNPKMERMFLIDVLDELDAAREWILLLGGRKVIERVASFLLLLGHREHPGFAPCEHGHQQPARIHVPIRRVELAQYLGTRTESLSRALHSLEARSIIRIVDPARFEILDTAALIRISGHEAPAKRDGARLRPRKR
ncbi:MAG: Crp/Fnr family transcriptional regulator [Pseudorhodobacter sp.]|nr:Crp/Fnr family transcriptional regulator [Pseudorhodobacter sp.]